MPALAISPADGLSLYLAEVRKYPLLDPEQEFMLASRWRKYGDPEAAHEMVASHLRLVVKIARGYRGYGLPYNDLISEGNVGLMQAIKRFEPDRGFRLATYALWWIRASIHEYVLRSWSLVKLGTTAAQKKLFFNLRKIKAQLQAMEDGDMLPETVTVIATELSVSEKDVVDMNRRLTIADQSLNAPIRGDTENEWQDWLVDESQDQETLVVDNDERHYRRGLLDDAMTMLTDRERHILCERRLSDEPQTLEDLSRQYDISRERVRQIEVRAFEKVQKAVRTAAYAA